MSAASAECLRLNDLIEKAFIAGYLKCRENIDMPGGPFEENRCENGFSEFKVQYMGMEQKPEAAPPDHPPGSSSSV
jgi:hypothetical protein